MRACAWLLENLLSFAFRPPSDKWLETALCSAGLKFSTPACKSENEFGEGLGRQATSAQVSRVLLKYSNSIMQLAVRAVKLASLQQVHHATPEWRITRTKHSKVSPSENSSKSRLSWRQASLINAARKAICVENRFDDASHLFRLSMTRDWISPFFSLWLIAQSPIFLWK
jgi:hypothetical protein